MDNIFNTPSDNFLKIWEHIITNINDSHLMSIMDIDENVMNEAKDDLLKLLENFKFDISELSKYLENKYDQEKVASFTALLRNRKAELLYKSVINHNCQYGEVMTDFDWLLKFVLGTSDIKALKYPVLQLITSTINTNGSSTKTVFDLNKDMLGKIIEALEYNVKIKHT